eukprot:m.38620 g.38620  ORF g.38620 m.38620 type:complete len:98 (+) comp17966_c0_seq3:99-392(+)
MCFKLQHMHIHLVYLYTDTYIRDMHHIMCLPVCVYDYRKGRTEVPGLTLDVDYSKGTVTIGGAKADTEQVVAFNGLGPVCQDIVVAGGLEKWIQQQL